MKYVEKTKEDVVDPQEYSAAVLRIPDADLQGYLDNGWTECTRDQWLLVQSPEVLAVADTEYSDDVPEGEAGAPVAEEPAPHVDPVE